MHLIGCSGTIPDAEDSLVLFDRVEGLQTTEEGGRDSFYVSLAQAPNSDVLLALESSDVSEGQLLVKSILFTPHNWFIPQEVVIQGIDDVLSETDMCTPYSIISKDLVSQDSLFDGYTLHEVTICNVDNDFVVDITIQEENSLYIVENLINTSYTIELGILPSSPIYIMVDPEYLSTDATLQFRLNTTDLWSETLTVTFTPESTSLSQTIYVSAVDDSSMGNTGSIQINHSVETLDLQYTNVTPPSIRTEFVDNDAISIIPTVGELLVRESAFTILTYSLLLSQPVTGSFILETTSKPDSLKKVLRFRKASSSDAFKPSLSTLVDNTFDSLIEIEVMVDNDQSEVFQTKGSICNSIPTTEDSNYAGAVVHNTPISIDNEDVATILIEPSEIIITEGFKEEIVFSLTAEPIEPVYIILNVPSSLEVEPNNILRFQEDNWQTVQTLTLDTTNLDDTSINSEDQKFTIGVTINSFDQAFFQSGLDLDIDVTVTDNDTPTLSSTPTELILFEGDDFTNYILDVTINIQPTRDVIVELLYNDDFITVPQSQNFLTFTSSNFDMQRVMIQANDNNVLSDLSSPLILQVSSDSDTLLADQEVTVPITIIDNDTPGLYFQNTEGNTVQSVSIQEGATETYKVGLLYEPTDDVILDLVVLKDIYDLQQSMISPETITFMADSWEDLVEVTITALSDDIDEDSSQIIIEHTSTDSHYSVTSNLSVSLEDPPASANAAILLMQGNTSLDSSSSIRLDEGNSLTYSVTLATQPYPSSSNVVELVIVSVDGELTISPSVLTFSSLNWDQEQTVQVTANVDTFAEIDMNSSIVHFVYTLEETYQSVTSVDFNIYVIDTNETPEVYFSESLDFSLFTSDPSTSLTNIFPLEEDGLSVLYYVKLATQPQEPVQLVIGFENSDVSSMYNCSTSVFITGTLNSNFLYFEPGEGEYAWDKAQTVSLAVYSDDDLLIEECKLTHTLESDDILYDEEGSIRLSDVDVNILDSTTLTSALSVNSLTIEEPATGISAPISEYRISLSATSVTPVNVLLTIDNFVDKFEVSTDQTTWEALTDDELTSATFSFTHNERELTVYIRVAGGSDDKVVNFSSTVKHVLTGGDLDGFRNEDNLSLFWRDASTAELLTPELPIHDLEVTEGENLPAFNFSLSAIPSEAVTLSFSLDNVSMIDTINIQIANSLICFVSICEWEIMPSEWNTSFEVLFTFQDNSIQTDTKELDISIYISSLDTDFNIGLQRTISISVLDDDTSDVEIIPSSFEMLENESIVLSFALTSEPQDTVTVTLTDNTLLQYEDPVTPLYNNTITFTISPDRWSIPTSINTQAINNSTAWLEDRMVPIEYNISSTDMLYDSIKCFGEEECISISILDEDVPIVISLESKNNNSVLLVDRYLDGTTTLSEQEAFVWQYVLNTEVSPNTEAIGLNPFVNYNASIEMDNSIVLLDSIDQAVIGETYTCVLRDSQTYCSSFIDADVSLNVSLYGELGITDEFNFNLSFPLGLVPVMDSNSSSLTNITKITAGYTHNCALNNSGTVYCWGEGSSGRLGTGSTNHSHLALEVHTSASNILSSVSAITAGKSHSCAIVNLTNDVYCWGDNSFGQTAQSPISTTSILYASSVSSLSNISMLNAGENHTCAIVVGSNREVACWGRGINGELGNGLSTTSATPVYVVLNTLNRLQNIEVLSVAKEHACAVDTFRTDVYCWGVGTAGQLGDGSIGVSINYAVLVDNSSWVSSGVTINSVFTGDLFSCARTSDLHLYCWGDATFFEEDTIEDINVDRNTITPSLVY